MYKKKIKVKLVLRQLGVKQHYKGYTYLVDAVTMAVDDPLATTGVTKHMYPTIAKRYNTKGANVERGIRHAIEQSWLIGDYNLTNELFGYTVGADEYKPTNIHYIAAVADYVRDLIESEAPA